MIEQSQIPAVQLKVLTDALRLAELEHHQDIPLREDFNHIPVGCSCGMLYSRDAGWEECKEHLREMLAQAVVRALHRPCESCLGTGMWHRFRADFECPDCDGRGRTLTPLPPMAFQDADGATWVVDELLHGTGRAVVHRDE